MRVSPVLDLELADLEREEEALRLGELQGDGHNWL